jgi:uroporphyrinogen decarboxylase
MTSRHPDTNRGSTARETMTSRQRVLAALSHQQPDRVPMDLGSTIVTGISIQAYDRLKGALELLTDETHVYDHEAQLAVVDEKVLQLLQIDTRGIRPGLSKRRSAIEADENGIWDEWGFWRKRSPDTGTYFIVKGPLVGEITTNDILNHPMPDPHDPGRTQGLRQKILDLRKKEDRAIMLSLPANFILTSMELRGFEDWYMDSCANQSLLGFLMDRVLEIQMVMCDNVLREVGDIIDIAVNFDDLALQDRLMVSPRVYQSLLEPRLKKLYQWIKSRTDVKILHHTDGAVKPLLGSLIDMGIDAINPVQVSAKGMDNLEELKNEYGKDLAFWGGIDTQYLLPRATPEEIRSSVLRTIDILNNNGGYVLCPVHNIQKDVPPENILALYNTVTQNS